MTVLLGQKWEGRPGSNNAEKVICQEFNNHVRDKYLFLHQTQCCYLPFHSGKIIQSITFKVQRITNHWFCLKSCLTHIMYLQLLIKRLSRNNEVNKILTNNSIRWFNEIQASFTKGNMKNILTFFSQAAPYYVSFSLKMHAIFHSKCCLHASTFGFVRCCKM